MEATLFSAFAVLLMPVGFGLLAAGLGRARNSAHTMVMHLLIGPATAAGMFFFGFALLGDTPAGRVAVHWVFHHSAGWLLQSDRARSESLAWFLLTAGAAAVCAAIPTGALVERWSLRSVLPFAFLIGAILFPIPACWLWTGGWLSQLGLKAHMGRGAIDCAGGGAVHLVGGTLAFVGTRFLRPRIGKYDESGRPRPILGHHLPMAMAGTILLAFAWFGFTTGRAFATGDDRAPLIAVNTLLAGSGGALAAALYIWRRFGRPDPSLTCNGLLAGLVSICAGCALVAPWEAVLIGILGAILAVHGVLLCERRGLDDPVGATGVHGFAGLWGMLAVGFFADGSALGPFNGGGSVRGLFHHGGGSQLLCQLIAAAVCIVWAAIVGTLGLAVLERGVGGNRVRPEIELSGLDIPETGAPAYPEFISRAPPPG